MFEKGKYSNFLTILLVVIVIAVLGLLIYVGYNIYSNYTTQKGASDFVDTFVGVEEKNDQQINTNENTVQNTAQNMTIENVTVPETSTNSTANSNKTIKRKQYKGYDTLGTIEIPATKAKYPVLAKVSTGSLNTAVAMLYPQNTELNTVGNVVIVGHNYRNGTFFSNNKKLKNGDKIYITDSEGKKITYIIYNIFETEQSDTSFYNRDTNGKREITLSTCTDASDEMRLIIEAREQ